MQQMHHHPHPVTETGEPVEPRMAMPPPLPPTSRVMADFFNELEMLVHKYNVRAHEELGLPVPESAKLKSMDDNDTVGKKRRRARKDPNAPKKPKTTYFLFMDDARNRMVPFIKQHIPDVLLKDITRVAAAIWREDVHEEEKQRYVQLYDNLKAKFIQDSKTFKERKEQAYAQAHAQAHAQQPLPAPTSHYMMDMHSPMKDVHPHAAAFGVPVVDEEEEEGDSDDDQKGRKKRKHKKKPFMQ